MTDRRNLSAEQPMRHHEVVNSMHSSPTQDPISDATVTPFKCNVCQRSYSRVDHLTRHFRSHTAEKSYHCHVCSKSFARADLLKRHVAAHTDGRRPRRSAQPRASRVSQACKACVQAKLKCREEKPCERCVNRGIVCVFERQEQHVHAQETNSGSNAIDVSRPSKVNFEKQRVETDDDWMMDAQNNDNIYVTAADNMSEMLPAVEPPPVYGTLEAGDNLFADFLRDIMLPSNMAPYDAQMQLDPTDTPSAGFRDLLSFGLDSNLELDNQDYSIIDFYQGKAPMEPAQPRISMTTSGAFEPPTPQSDATHQPSSESLALGTEAFKRSLWCWTPVGQDSGQVEQINLTLSREDMSNPGAQFINSDLVASKIFGSESRDAIIAMILDTCERKNFPKVMSSFPSAELLNSLMQCFLATHVLQTDSWIHLPTLRVHKSRPELLSAFLAAGATFSSSLTIRKLGFAIQEAVRLYIPKVCDENNSVTRELDLLQAFLLSLDVGLWSGNKRKMELAESQAHILVTMCRRASSLLRSTYQHIQPLESDTGKILEQKWRAWAKQESLKRLVFHLFIRDAQSSISLAVPMLLSYAELTLPLPCPSAFFHAPSATAWKALYDTQTSLDRLPSLPQCLYDLSPVNAADAHHYLDVPLSFSLIGYGMWGLILEFRTLTSVLKTYPLPDQLYGSNSLVLSHRRQELCHLLDHYILSLPSLNLSQPGQDIPTSTPVSTLESYILVSLLSCHLNVSFNDIQLFAGREGEEEARRVYPGLQSWVESKEARTALWHAGQVIRYSKALGNLMDFFAVAVYHAGLVFWTYGVLSLREDRFKTGTGSSYNTSMDAELFVWLDGRKGEEAQKFIALGKGAPCFSCGGDVARIHEPENVMSAILKVLEGNGRGKNEVSGKGQMVVTPLIANLGELIKELGSAARVVTA